MYRYQMKIKKIIVLSSLLLALTAVPFSAMPQQTGKGVYHDLNKALAEPGKVRTLILNYSSGIDPLIQQADPLVIGIGSAKQRTMV